MAKDVKYKVSQSGVEKVSGEFGKVDKSLVSMAKTALASIGAMYALKKAMDFAIAAKNAARDATEIRSKFDAVFKDMTVKANKMADGLASSFGLAGTTARKLLGDTADLLTGFGFAQEEALNFSIKTNQLAIDLASFTNYAGGAEGATSALVRAFTGEREALKSLGIVVSEEMVKLELTRLGKEKLTGQSLMQAKAEATLNIAYTQSKNAIGDYARTQDESANVERRRKEAQKELIEQVGMKLAPAFNKANLAAMDFFKTLTETSLETTVRQLKEMGIEAEKLVGLTYMIDLEKSLDAVNNSSAKITKELSIWGNLLGEGALKSIGIILEQMPDIEGSWSSIATVQDKSLLTQKNIQNIMAGLTSEAITLSQKGEELSKKDKKRLDNLYKQSNILSGILKVVIERDGAEQRLIALGAQQTTNATELRVELEKIAGIERPELDIEEPLDIESLIAGTLEYYDAVKKTKEEWEELLKVSKPPEEWGEFTDSVDRSAVAINNLMLIAQQASQTMSAFSGLQSVQSNNRIREYTDEANAKIAAITNSTKTEEVKEREIAVVKADLRKKEIAEMKKLQPLKYAQAITNTAVGVTGALGMPPWTPFNFILAGLVAAAGAAQIATIAAQKYATGGVVPGTGTRDTVPAMLTPGEVVLNAAQQSNLAGGMGGITINVSGNLIATEEEADRFAKIIQERSRLGFNQIQVRA